MARQLNEHRDQQIGGIESMPLAIGLFASISFLVGLCAKHALRRVSQNRDAGRINKPQSSSENDNPSPKKLGKSKDGEFGEGGLWQKSILMGEKCRPPEFPGAIYYDSHGKQVSEMPRSPRSSPLSSFTFPVVQESN